MKERVWPTEKQYFDGVMDDGSKPPIHSDDFFDDVKSGRKRFLHPAEIPPPGMRGKDPADMTEAELLMQIDLQEYRAINQACNYAQSMIKMGEAALNTEQEPGAPATGNEPISTTPKQTTGENTVNNNPSPDTSNNDATESTVNNNPAPESPNHTGYTKQSTGQRDYNLPDIPDLPELQDLPKNPYQLRRVRTWKDDAESKARKQREAQHKQVKDDVLREVAGESTAAGTATARTAGTAVSRPLTRTQMIVIGERGARLMLKLAPARAEIARRLVKYAKKLDTKDEFLNNRAVAVVKHTLLAMDEAYEDIGFAGWMPFRAIDQWLMFCGVLQRVLAANGLIHSEHAEVYRKLMEETPPPIEPDWRTPQSWGKCYVNRAFRTMDYLKETIQLVDEGRPPP